jgi:L-ribulokinase
VDIGKGDPEMAEKQYVIGIDFGTDSVRSIVVDSGTGKTRASEVVYFKRWGEGRYCDPAKNQFRQHPLDYIEGLEKSVRRALAAAGKGSGRKVVGIGVDTTGSTPAPVDRDGAVLALRKEFQDNPNAMFVLWKDHTAVEEAEAINGVAKGWGGIDVTKYVGGVYSSEWFWSKILHVLRVDPQVREAAFSWVEHADWVPALLTGKLNPMTMKRGRCPAGHKAMWHREWGGLPPEEFLVAVDPLFAGLRARLYAETSTADEKAGELTAQWAERLGLAEGVSVAVGAFDAHMGAVGTEITEKTFVKILGTSCCDMAVAPADVIGDKLVAGICGQVDGSIIPGLIGLEAGQSAYGDVYAWFKNVLMWPCETMLPRSKTIDGKTAKKVREEIEDRIVKRLSEEAAKLESDETVPIALDWLNGRRTPYADQRLKGALLGLSLGTSAAGIFKALVESTAYGAKAIIDRFREEGVHFDQVVASGGIPKKSPYVMQVLSDVIDLPVKVAESEQAGALGAAMFAAVAAGVHPSIHEAQEKMGSGFSTTYHPRPEKAAAYAELYGRYREIGGLLEEQLRK